jgi:hypothetical protein
VQKDLLEAKKLFKEFKTHMKHMSKKYPKNSFAYSTDGGKLQIMIDQNTLDNGKRI